MEAGWADLDGEHYFGLIKIKADMSKIKPKYNFEIKVKVGIWNNLDINASTVGS